MTTTATDTFDRFPWTDDMDEISGFGGSYEGGCRRMVSAGMAWLTDNPELAKAVRFEEFENIIGVAIAAGEPAKEFETAMLDAPILSQNGEPTTVGKWGATGAMHQFSMHHAMKAHKVGWPEYQRLMREKEKREIEGAA